MIHRERTGAELAHSAASMALCDFVALHGGPRANGLTPDHVKAMPEWKRLYSAERRAWSALQDDNAARVRARKAR